jgi:hypothetical protein
MDFARANGERPLARGASRQKVARWHIWTCPIVIDFSELRFKVTTADLYPASLRGLIDHRRKPLLAFARQKSLK